MRKFALVALAATLVAGPLAGGAQAAPTDTPNLALGSKGAAVKKLQQRLLQLKYDPGKADGKFGGTTRAAVWAFQKVNGLETSSTGKVGRKTWKALDKPKLPTVITAKKKRERNRVEVNISKQLVVVYKNGKIALISHTSTGSGRYEDGAVSRTPRGYFRVERKIKGVRHAPLGTLYNPIYFYRGYALHGSPNVPLYPDSHGCARLPFGTDMKIFNLVPIGWQVRVK
ncbi:L,D-transpeptidase family protein [Actinocorallia sp. A-T 12471]|uniref:L,D-transpeptidase family protein n=1 Tax=Actinocorallia sp. A-T 12471 TaxID=3089813 RepID=UPI0029CB6FFD|nr:L,D-transpeptidase family protein [Actinocorallia sp. A-T 12471]MDX6742915.1 L,D-transpeptidase family protein [Actinocorallia sp. A-T 12471]